jgi:Cytochrome C oxidase, cbb3-type, subunit III
MRPARADLLLACLALLELAGCRRDAGSTAQAYALARDPYHPPPMDTLPPESYEGWKQYRLHCDRCHGEDARGTSFGPDLLPALRPTGSVPTEAVFIALLINGRPERGMPPATRLGLSPGQFPGLYAYLLGRSQERYRGGRPARQASRAAE